MQYNSEAESHLAVKVVLAGNVVGPMTEAIALPTGTSALNVVV